MLRNLKKEIFYPYPPQRVWQVLTNSQVLATWLMENDFEPRIGHKFRFLCPPLPGLDGSISCEVIELDEPKRLSYTWQDSMMCQPSIVTWTLKPVDGGTRVQLEHKGLRQEFIGVGEPMRYSQAWQGQFMHESTAVTQTLAPNARSIVLPSIPVGMYVALDSVILNSFINGGWDYKLSEKMPQVLVSLAINN
ncbi:SRPBCC domain-containing protein [Chlorogloeopsis sp. ULAP01]|uniref:SRPBCC family protein n=1 Tax=Chlorogloeopsis sp. ULAP01 TaxID=3056483 RepID=UPI0025AAF862|nr:SRPBCC domain-containing protein [Chlorogloeopsis sp. ULAP01]MDM9382091.1 SRPBCC domain-containing protein [Chlorogloeopsis sp. ULAP01]